MRKILLSLVAISIVGVSAVRATSAYFTDAVTINSMNLATGILDINDVSNSWMTHVSFENLKPGDLVRKWVVLQNAGNLDIASLKVSAVNKNDPDKLLEQLKVTVYGTVDGYDQGIYTPDWGKGQPISDWLTEVDILGTAVYRNATAGHVLSPGKKDTIIIDFIVPTTLGNEWQGKTASFDLRFDAEQSHTGSNYY
ncbi:TPA: hypothetical protein ENX78_17840 [Candidatus Poribacteria bacterium]|nr:hypothetical protein [Candidatus Poribacteria bacterium]